MRFAFGDFQLEFQQEVRNLLGKTCTPTSIRSAWPPETAGSATDPDRQAWAALAEMGVLDVVVPEADGGLGLDETSLVLILQEAGYAGLPDPLVETAAVAMPLAAGRVESGQTVTSDLGGPIVPWAADADLLLLQTAGGGLSLVEPGAVTLDPVETVDGSRRAARVAWDGRGGTVLAEPGSDAAALAFDRGALGTAAELVGLGQRMLDLTVGYVIERKQFGVAIGSFQAVKHHLADAARDLAFARPAVHRAAWSVATGSPDRARDVSMAKAMASNAAESVGRASLQCHGAIGYTMEYDLHLFLKRSWSLARGYGDAAFHTDRVGTSIGL